MTTATKATPYLLYYLLNNAQASVCCRLVAHLPVRARSICVLCLMCDWVWVRVQSDSYLVLSLCVGWLSSVNFDFLALKLFDMPSIQSVLRRQPPQKVPWNVKRCSAYVVVCFWTDCNERERPIARWAATDWFGCVLIEFGMIKFDSFWFVSAFFMLYLPIFHFIFGRYWRKSVLCVVISS